MCVERNLDLNEIYKASMRPSQGERVCSEGGASKNWENGVTLFIGDP